MGNDLKEKLKEEMVKRKIRIPKLSLELEIPKDRIYAWYRDNTNPKGDDRDKIEKWINGERSILKNNETQEPESTYSLRTPIQILEQTLQDRDDTIAILKKTIVDRDKRIKELEMQLSNNNRQMGNKSAPSSM